MDSALRVQPPISGQVYCRAYVAGGELIVLPSNCKSQYVRFYAYLADVNILFLMGERGDKFPTLPSISLLTPTVSVLDGNNVPAPSTSVSVPLAASSYVDYEIPHGCEFFFHRSASAGYLLWHPSSVRL